MKTEFNYVEDLTEEKIEASINSLRRITQQVDDLNIQFKKIIEDRLIKDPRVIYLLDSDDLDPMEPDTYLGVHIKPYVRVPEAQEKVKNYICYTVDMDDSVKIYNKSMKRIVITFTIFCEEKNIDTEFGVCRHDLMGYLIKDDFNWSNMFGGQSQITYDKESVTDTCFSVRTIRFELTGLKDNVKTFERVNEEGDVEYKLTLINDRVDK